MAKKKIGKKSKGSRGKAKVKISIADLIVGLETTIKRQWAILEVLESMPEKAKKAKLLTLTTEVAASGVVGIAVGQTCRCEDPEAEA